MLNNNKLDRVSCDHIIWWKEAGVIIDLAVYKKVLCEEILTFICSKRCDKSKECTKKELFLELINQNGDWM